MCVRAHVFAAGMFEQFDADQDGVLTLQELTEGLAMYGLSPQETKEMFFPELAKQELAHEHDELSSSESDGPDEFLNAEVQLADWKQKFEG